MFDSDKKMERTRIEARITEEQQRARIEAEKEMLERARRVEEAEMHAREVFARRAIMESMLEKKRARAERLSGLLDKANGKTQANLARFCNVTAPAAALWVKNGAFTYDNAVKIAKYFGINPDWLYSGQGNKFDIPAVAQVTTAADRFAEFDVEIRRGEDWVKINQPAPVAFNQDYLGSEAIIPNTCRLIRAQGDRMAPTIKAGEFLLVNEAEKNVISGSVYAVSVNGEFLLCQISRITEGIRLHYDNEIYPDEDFTNETMSQVSIIGRVILSVRQF